MHNFSFRYIYGQDLENFKIVVLSLYNQRYKDIFRDMEDNSKRINNTGIPINYLQL